MTEPSNSPENVHNDLTLAEGTAGRLGTGPDAASNRIGPYKLIRVLGEGGFGIVYLAEQASPQRRVAVKVLRAGVAGPHALSRFGHEAETLGLLQHPGIAQVFEAGFYDPKTGQTLADDGWKSAALQGGLPFFAMEYVDGVPLTAHADRQSLSRRDRLELLIQICEAVGHAHTKGVIHRDLKPSNILVDRSGRAKILDFGVARVTSDRVQRTIQTDAGQIVGTLGYMSPEQIAADPAGIDTRADVYALGAVLYELLSGSPPHRVEGKLLHEATRVICEQPPSRLATIDRTLRGDLDTIVAKALEKDKARRYQSAADLAADLRRYLHDQPIIARPASSWYQLRKFARRNKPLVGGVVASFLLLAAGVAGTSYWAVRASAAERDEATRRGEAEDAKKDAVLQRDSARREADKANAVVRFLESTLAAADPDKKGRDVRLADMLDSAVAEIDQNLTDKPEVAAAMRLAIARAYKGLGLLDAASTQAEGAVKGLVALHGPDHADALDARETLAMIRTDQSRFQEAEAELLSVHEARARAAGGEDLASLDTLSNLAQLYSQNGRLEPAEATARRALAESIKVDGLAGEAATSMKLQLGQILSEAGKIEEAESLLNEVLEARVRELDPRDQKIQNVREALGGLYRMQAKYDKAAQVHAATLEIFKLKYGPEHAKTLSKSADLGKSLQQAGKLDEAEAVLGPALEASRRVIGPDHFDTLTLAAFLADTMQAKGELAKAAELRGGIAEARARSLGPDHPQTLIAWTTLAYVLIDQHEHARAEEILLKALEARRRTLGPEHPDVGVTLSMLGLNAIKAGEAQKAEGYLRPCLTLREKLLPEKSGIRGVTMSLLGESIMLQGRLEEAGPLVTTGADWVIGDARAPARNKREAAERAARLCELREQPDEAAAWRGRVSVSSK